MLRYYLLAIIYCTCTEYLGNMAVPWYSSPTAYWYLLLLLFDWVYYEALNSNTTYKNRDK